MTQFSENLHPYSILLNIILMILDPFSFETFQGIECGIYISYYIHRMFLPFLLSKSCKYNFNKFVLVIKYRKLRFL